MGSPPTAAKRVQRPLPARVGSRSRVGCVIADNSLRRKKFKDLRISILKLYKLLTTRIYK